MDGELLLQPVVEPGIVFVSSADPAAGAGGNDAKSCEALDTLELLLLLRVLDLDGVRVTARFPHGGA